MPSRLPTLASGTALAVALSAAALSAHAAVFAEFTPVSGMSDFKWVQNGSGGELFSINASGDSTAQGVATRFTFLPPAYAALVALDSTFTFDGTSPSGNPAVFNSAAGTFTQLGLSGSFHFTYSGPDTTIGGFHLIPGENLLSGVFSNAWIQGGGTTGSANASPGNGGSATYSSDLFNFTGEVPGSEGFAMNLLSVTPGFSAPAGQALVSFTGNGGGNFDFVTGTVPEPAAWALMILGFGGAGAMLRRRRVGEALA